ncbi:MAG: hypothetical protein AAF511_12805 [Pseudomonadota bacterium]
MADHDPSDFAGMTFKMLQGIQKGVGDFGRDVFDLKGSMTNVKISLGQMQVKTGQFYGRMDTIDQRVERIETRLGLSEAHNPAAG